MSKVPIIDATEAHKYLNPEAVEGFKEALASADREGKEIYEVYIEAGVPILHSMRDKTT